MAAPDIPDWLTKDFFQSCLQSRETQPTDVTNFTIHPAVTSDGNNYGSQLLRVKIDYNKGDDKCSISLIIKAPIANIETLFSEVYVKEVKFYREFISETYKFCQHDIVPMYYSSPHPHCVVLEDLCTSGYVMVNRHNLLDLEHCQLYIKAKAKLNALFVAVHRKNPKAIESLLQFSGKKSDQLQQIMKMSIEMGLKGMAAYLEDKPEYKEYLDIIKEASEGDISWKMYQEIENSNSNRPLKVLAQMDPWCTNMMFKYDSLGKVESVKLLDFQNLSLTSPIVELVIFLSVSPNMEVRKTKLNSLYHLYCDELNRNLVELKCPERIDFEEMKRDVMTMSPLILMYTCALLPLALFEGAVDMSDLLANNTDNVPIKETALYRLYQGEHFNRLYPHILYEIDKEGVFSYLKKKITEMKTK